MIDLGEWASERQGGPETDADWNEQVTLEIGPHPELSETQEIVAALDYGLKDGKAKIPVCKALLYYALKRLGLDTDLASRRAQDQQIVPLNRVQLGRRGEPMNGLD